MNKDPYYQSRYTYDDRRAIVWKEIIRFESRFIPENAVVVDLGAGYCDFINKVKGKTKYAVDKSPELSKFADKGTILINREAWSLYNIPNHSVDIIHASHILEHFTDDEIERTMSEIVRILKPRGRLILMQPNYKLCYKKYFDDPTHKKVFSDVSLKNFLESHEFRIMVKKARFLPFDMNSTPPLIPNIILPLIVWLYIRSPIKPLAGQMLFIAEK